MRNINEVLQQNAIWSGYGKRSKPCVWSLLYSPAIPNPSRPTIKSTPSYTLPGNGLNQNAAASDPLQLVVVRRKEGKMAKKITKVKSSAFMKPMRPSEDLAKIVGAEPLPRTEVTKRIWAHIKKHKLQNPTNKREILADDKLQPIFGAKKLNMFQMTKAVNKHLK